MLLCAECLNVPQQLLVSLTDGATCQTDRSSHRQGSKKNTSALVSTHTYQTCPLDCCLGVNPYLSDMSLGVLQDNSLNPGTGDKVTFHVATHLATAKAADKAGGANSKYAGMSSLAAPKTCLKSINA